MLFKNNDIVMPLRVLYNGEEMAGAVR